MPDQPIATRQPAVTVAQSMRDVPAVTERTALADNRRLRAAVAQQAAELEQRNQRLEQLTVQHMAELERSRLQNDRILASAPVGIICVDIEGRITFANPWAAGMMGYSADELRGQPLRTHMQLSTAGPSGAADKGQEVAGQYLSIGEELCWREDGTSFPIAYESAPSST
jgi:PAS domain S-box-containing protein